MTWCDVLGLAERELELVRSGDAAALPAAIEERARLAETLGLPPRPVLERLLAVQEQIVVELTLARDGVVRELGSLQRGRSAVRGYRASA
jgi:hypothetical protein